MNSIKFKTWLLWAAVLFILSLLADYYFLHILFHEKNNAASATISEGAREANDEEEEDDSFLGEGNTSESEQSDSNVNSFLESLKGCAPEIAAQGIGTPEALVEYLQKSVGVANQDVFVENFHITLPDGSKRRVHVIMDDNTNSTQKKEIRFFKLDAEGYPDRLPLKNSDTLESLLALGTLTRHESKSLVTLKDDTFLEVEMHDNKVFEFQYNNQGRILSCRYTDCVCPNP